MPKYCYTQLSQPTSNIRLLRLLPSENDPQNLRCELFEYSLRNSPPPYYPYEALSYVWGGEDKPCSILLNNQSLSITRNLYALLLRLRAHSWSRVVWADAVCINQEDTEKNKEKEQQIPLIAEIYARAQRVLVWLGEAEADGEQALGAILHAGSPFGTQNSHAESSQAQIRTLLRRPWFQRIWVLQEVAAARHISIMCGSEEIDGHAFSLGLESLEEALERPVTQVALIQDAIFRTRNIPPDGGRLSLDIGSLGELVDMYHSHKATRLHDKVYALFGMCSEDLTVSRLKPDYDIEWKELMRQLVKFILGGQVSIETWDNKQMAVIEGKGYILGTVSQVRAGMGLAGKQNVEVTPSPMMHNAGSNDNWIISKPAIPIQQGDIICHLQGAPRPSIVRFIKNHFVIVMIAAFHSERPDKVDEIDQRERLLQPRELSLIWNWESSSEEAQDLERLNNLTHMTTKELSQMDLTEKLRWLVKIWDAAHILKAARNHEMAEIVFQKAVKGYEAVFGDKQPSIWETHGVIPTLFSWATGNGYEPDVQLLLATGKVDIDSKDNSGQTPLSWAAQTGNEPDVQLLLATGKVDIDSKDNFGQTPLLWAARNGHEPVVQLLLATGKVDVDSKDKEDGRTPLSWAANNGHGPVVQMLLATEKVDINSKNKGYGQTPLSLAAQNGHEPVVQLLLATGKVDIESKDKKCGQTPLSWAANNGHGPVVQLLLATRKIDVNSKAIYGQTPLSWAAVDGHEAVVQLLLATGKVDINSEDQWGRTPLMFAAKNGHGPVVQLLLATGKVDIDSEDEYGRTPLSFAAEDGYEHVVQLLLATGKVDTESKDKKYGQTPLSWAAKNGHEAVVKLLRPQVAIQSSPNV